MSDVTATDITRLIAAVDAEMRLVGTSLCPGCLREAAGRARALACESYQNMVARGHAPEDSRAYAVRLSTRLAAEVAALEARQAAPDGNAMRALVVRVSETVGRELWGRPQ